MTDSLAQLAPAVGYLRQYPAMTCAELERAAGRLAVFARQRGFVLTEVFVEQLATDPAAFDALVTVVKRGGIPVVEVPTQAHLSAVGGGETKARRLKRETGAQALTAGGSPP
ncbi:hypothetical protein E1263_24625 [Kribbella antibiotica]|uniref:Uncharacterized protein n=1 Tax=Kribbella antibiotica TaxID=190195 RepID=A0A4R4ZGD0_9ACTN|nr:hypothetical protein [Kribbella antibiotica]TDD57106.1 hypothetical protein E1263_24625 [Kribbella antibiotica]